MTFYQLYADSSPMNVRSAVVMSKQGPQRLNRLVPSYV
jgi:hypothetical protein